MSAREAEVREFNVRLRRICPDARGRYSPAHEPSRRWQVLEEHELALSAGPDEETILAGVRKKCSGVVCWAATELEARHLYSRIKSEQRQQDADIAAGRAPKGKPWTILLKEQAESERQIPPPEPKEWAADREKIAWAVRQSKERMAEQIRATTRNFMAINGIEARDLTRKQKAALGIGRMGDDWKGR